VVQRTTERQEDTRRDPNPPYGEKRGFRKVTLTLPPTSYERLIQESVRRKLASERNHLLSALLREAVTLYISFLDAVEG
jgi:hypothetical protein